MIETPFMEYDFSGESAFPTTEGGLLKVAESYETKAQVVMGIYHTDDTDDHPSDVLYTRFRLPDQNGVIWESESRFGSDILVEKMNELSTPSQLFPYASADQDFKDLFAGKEVLRGIRYSSDDRIYRSIPLQDKVVSFSFHYTTITFDLAFHTGETVGNTQLIVKLHENSLFTGSEDLGALLFSTTPFIGPNTAAYNLEEEWWQENPIPAPAPFSPTSASHNPNKNVKYR